MFVAALVAVVVQVLGWLLLEGVVQAFAVLGPWALVTIVMVLTTPIARRGLPTPRPSLAQAFAPIYPSAVYIVPSLWLGVFSEDLTALWFTAGFAVLAVVAGIVLWRRVRHHRRGPAPLVALRRADEVS